MQEKGIVCRTSPSLAFVSHFCLISRELKTASSGAYSPGAPIQLLPHDVPCANKNSSVLILLQDYPPFPTRIQRFHRQERKKRFLLFPAPYPLKKAFSSDIPIKLFISNTFRCLANSGLRESTLDRKYARRMSLHRAFPFSFYQTESRSSGARYIPSPSFTPKVS